MKEDYIVQESAPVDESLDLRKLRETRMRPANEILNRTNFYTLMDAFSADTSDAQLQLLFSPTVTRDLRIFDVMALQDAIHSTYSFEWANVPKYPRSPMLWMYAKYNCTIAHPHLTKSVAKKRFVLGGICVLVLFCVSFFISVLAANALYFALGIVLFAVYHFSGIFLFHKKFPSWVYDDAVLDTYPLVDYTGV